MIKYILPTLLLVAPFAQAQDSETSRLERRLMAIENRVFTADGGDAAAASVESLADFEVRLQQLEEQSRRVYGGVEELSHAVEELAHKLELISKDQDLRIQEMEKKLAEGVVATKPAASGEEGAAPAKDSGAYIAPDLLPEQHYQQAYNYLTTAAYDYAEEWFKAFVERHPNHRLAENSYYWLGEVYLVKKQPKDAIISFTEGLKKFPDGQKVPGILLKMGVAFERMEQFDHAKSTWKKLIEEFPDSSEAQKAQKKLDEIG